MTRPDSINARAVEIGRAIFDLADAAQPRVWEKAWWSEQMTRLVDRDERLRTRAFQFVDCLPALQTSRQITRHLNEYMVDGDVSLPPIVGAMIGDGPFQTFREELVGAAARRGAVQMAERFITGYDVPSAIKTILRLRNQRMGFTIDVLGESTTSYRRADAYAAVYHELIDKLSRMARGWAPVPMIDQDSTGDMPRVNLSIKLTGLDPHFDAIDPDRSIRVVAKRLRPILRRAKAAGAFVNVDMESFKHRDITLEFFKTVLMEEEFRDWSDIGIVVQAYLKDGERDLESLLHWVEKRGAKIAVRLVKGAYWDAETAAAVRNYSEPPVWTRKWETDACYERMTETMLRRADLIRPAFASHNVRSLACILATAEHLGMSPREYEVQMLYGMGDPLKTAMVEMGQCVRVYCPYGDLMPGMGYLIRRLLENTSNDGFLKQGFGDRRAHLLLLQDPTVSRPPSAPMPKRFYQNSDPEEPMASFQNASNTSFTKEENRRKLSGAIEYVKGEGDREYPLLIGGESITTGTWGYSVNPSQPDQRVGAIAQASTTEVDAAVAAARLAFGDWRSTSAAERAKLLRDAADRVENRRFELAATMILEVGKPWREADADVTEGVDHLRYYADQIERIESHPRLRNIPGENNMLTYSPKGVCTVVSPWSFPFAILTGMTSAALAAGNTVVMKPASPAAVIASKLVEVLQEAGLPSGVVNFVPGPGASIGDYLVSHRDVNVVAFTGSHVVGLGVLHRGTAVLPKQSFIKKMIVEMGGKNAIIVDDDADVDGAVQAIIESAFGYAGQKCSSCSRVIALEGIHDLLAERLVGATESLPIGKAESPSTLVGPLISEEARDRALAYIQTGQDEGRLLVQARLPEDCRDGFFAAPTIISDIEPEARLANEEVYGPVVALMRAKDFDHALEIANGTRYALTGGVFSRSPGNIENARRDFAVGNLYINRRITGSQVDAQPFGGFRLSGTGVKAGSPDYLTHFMDARCITENTARSGFVPDQQHTEV